MNENCKTYKLMFAFLRMQNLTNYKGGYYERYFYECEKDVQEFLDINRTTVYQIINDMNQDLLKLGYRKNPKDKIYMMMNRKDVEASQKSYEEIDIFLK